MSHPNTEARLRQLAEVERVYAENLVAVEAIGLHLERAEFFEHVAATLEQAKRALQQHHAELLELRRRSRQPLETDISNYSDEWCEGFLAGQTHALDVALSFGGAPAAECWCGKAPPCVEAAKRKVQCHPFPDGFPLVRQAHG